jgi:WD40 repeat protein
VGRGLVNIGIGLFAILFGIGLSIWSYESAQQGSGHYLITGGIVLVGIWRLLVGVFQLVRGAASKDGRRAIGGLLWPSSLAGLTIRVGVIFLTLVAIWIFAPESWKSFSPPPLRTLEGTDDIRAVAFSPDGKWLAAAMGYGGWRIWNVTTWDQASAPDFEPYLDVEALAFAPDGHAIAAATSNGLRVWTSADWGTGKPILSAQSKLGAYGVAFSPDGKSIATGSVAAGLLVFDAQTAQPKWPPAGKDSVPGVAFSHDGRMIAYGASDGSIKLVDAGTDTSVLILQRQNEWQPATTLTFFPDGRLATGSYQRAGIEIWDSGSGTLLKTLKATNSLVWGEGTIWSIAVSPDEKWVAAGDSDGSVRLWTQDNIQPAKSFFGHAKDVLSVAFSPDGKTIASGGADHKIQLWATPQ